MNRHSAYRTAIAGLTGGLLVGVAACSTPTPSGEQDTPTPSGEQDGGATSTDGETVPEGDGEPLEVWSRSGPEAAANYQTVMDAFTAKTGIEVEYFATVEFATQLQARATAKDLPDVMIYDQSSMAQFANQGMLLPVVPEELEGFDEVSEESWASVQLADGDYYGVPWSQHAQVMFVRKDWREALGFEVPTTHDELVELATAFATGDPDGNGVAGDTFGSTIQGSTDRGVFAWAIVPYLWQRGGSIVEGSDGKYTVEVDSPETLEALEWVRREWFCTPNMVQPGALSNASATPFFAEGKAGIFKHGPFAFSDFDNSLGSDKYEVIPHPEGPTGISTVLQERTSIYFGATTNKPEQQMALAEFMISAEGQETSMTGPGQPNVRLPINTTLDAVEVHGGDERWVVTAEQLEDSRLFPSEFDFTVIRQDVAESLYSLLGSCDADLEPQLAELADRVREELAAQDVLA